ncbi:MAG: FAD-dependent oxidoreductase [Pseudomonadota bacterium]
MERARDIAVIGAGAVGVSVALALARQAGGDGSTVTCIDAEAPGSGASRGNAGVIVAGGALPLAMPGATREALGLMVGRDRALRIGLAHLTGFLPWARRAFATATTPAVAAAAKALDSLATPAADLWRADLDDADAARLITESRFVFASRHGPIDAEALTWRLKRQYGVQLRVLDRAGLAALEPALSPAYRDAIAMEGMARLRDPQAATGALARTMLRQGGTILRAAVTAVRRDGARWRLAMAPPDGPPRDLAADIVVVAAGWASARLLRPLGLDIPLEAEHGRHVMLPAGDVEIANSVMDFGARMVASRMEGGIRLAGSSAFTGPGTPPEAERDLPAMLRIATRMFPGIDVSGAVPWAGSRPSLPDSLPAIGPVPGHPGLWAAFGHGHYGLTMAPATGRLVAAMIRGAPSNIDPRPFDPARFLDRDAAARA